MADEIRVTTVGGEEVHRVAGEPAGEEGPLVIDARDEIQATRARISGTIDEIEEALRRKRDRIERRLDILAPIRDRPLQVLGAVFAAGLVLGLLTGGDDEEGEEEEARPAKGRGAHRGREEDHRWESRTRRLLRIAREQEEELEALRRRSARRPARAVMLEDGDYEIEDDYDDDGETGEQGTAMDRLKEYVMEHVSGLAAEAVQQLVRRAGRG